MRALLVLIPALALAACSAQPAKTAATCPAERAVYRLRGQPAAELALVKPPHPMGASSDLAARLSLEGQAWWFSFTSSNGYSRDYLILTDDPALDAKADDKPPAKDEDETGDGGLTEIVAFDAAYNVLMGPPQAGQAAPAHILATVLGLELWYANPRRELKKAMWDLDHCGDGKSR